MKILNLDQWGDKATEILSEGNQLYGVYDVIGTWLDGIVTSLSGPIKYNASFFKSFPDLKFIASCTTGLDHIDTDYCKTKSIKIISLQGETDFLRDIYATAEHTWALILSLIRKVPFAFDDVKQGNWDREEFQGIELQKKRLGIIGHGRVGQQITAYAKAFRMKADVFDIKGRMRTPLYKWSRPWRWYDSLYEALQGSDIITVHVPLIDQTKEMFSFEEFKQMKPTAYFINTSRGQVVDEDALLWALDNKIITGAALDVVQNEPNINPKLIEYAKNNSNLLLTCHIGGNTGESREKTQLHIAQKIKEFIEKQS